MLLVFIPVFATNSLAEIPVFPAVLRALTIVSVTAPRLRLVLVDLTALRRFGLALGFGELPGAKELRC